MQLVLLVHAGDEHSGKTEQAYLLRAGTLSDDHTEHDADDHPVVAVPGRLRLTEKGRRKPLARRCLGFFELD